MANLKAISDALKLVDSKKQNLKKAFDDLQGHSHLLSSSPLSWSDIESHFTSIHNSLTKKFQELESLESQVILNQPEEKKSFSSLDPLAEIWNEPDEIPECVSPRPELKRLCEEMDGKGLSKYVSDLPNDREAVRKELPAALKCAPDQKALVLDAMEGFFNGNTNSKKNSMKFANSRRGCILLLETLMDNCPNVGIHISERAKKLAHEWKQNLSKDGKDPLDALGFLHLVAAFKLTSEFDLAELVEYFIIIARYRQATKLCKVVGLGDKVADIVQKLLDQGKHLFAVKFVFEFELTGKFPPVPILKDHVKETKKAAKEVCKEGRNSLRALNEATSKEVGALRSVIRFIDEYKLSDYPREHLEKRIDQLEKQRSNRKRPVGASSDMARQKQPHQAQQARQRFKKQKLPPKRHMLHHFPINRSHMAAPYPNLVGVGNPSYPPYQHQHQHQQTHLPSAGLVADHAAPYQQSHLQPSGLLPNHPVSYAQSHLQPAGLLPDHSAPFESSSAMAYGMSAAGSTPAAASYHGSSAEYYGFAGGPMGYPGNATPANSHTYPSEPYAPPGYGGVGVPPPYHPSYYPQ